MMFLSILPLIAIFIIFAIIVVVKGQSESSHNDNSHQTNKENMSLMDQINQQNLNQQNINMQMQQVVEASMTASAVNTMDSLNQAMNSADQINNNNL